MADEAVALWPVLSQLQERARRLEQEMATLRADLDQVADMLSRPVATYVVDGEEFVITEADVAAVRARLVRPCSDEAAQELALADRLAERDKNLPEAEIRRPLGEEIEAIRAEAIAKGAAIDDPIEAVVDGCGYRLCSGRRGNASGNLRSSLALPGRRVPRGAHPRWPALSVHPAR